MGPGYRRIMVKNLVVMVDLSFPAYIEHEDYVSMFFDFLNSNGV
jgi:hypothetical protein